MLEIWKEIDGYNGRYMVSNQGRVKSLYGKGRVLKKRKDKKGYFSVILSLNGVPSYPQIHRLMAIAFLGHDINNKNLVVDHINNKSSDNRICNLQIITHRENLSKYRKGYSSKYIGVNWDKNLCKWKSRIFINGKSKYLGCFTDELEAATTYQTELSKITNK